MADLHVYDNQKPNVSQTCHVCFLLSETLCDFIYFVFVKKIFFVETCKESKREFKLPYFP